ncbi:hypothetical protein RJ640_009950 [Escallonia rubra]|uniref:Uncharacterized protein n=1 Tax=Escallonia rubra TaxID=112253 RepID=A0AA88QRG8_9ASTE|nr:hypothetical protein RJ640_009950 [Escallonia rubra]
MQKLKTSEAFPTRFLLNLLTKSSDPTNIQLPLSPLTRRRSNRAKEPSILLRDYHCYYALATLHEPNTFREATSNPLEQKATTKELHALPKTCTWDMVDLPHGKIKPDGPKPRPRTGTGLACGGPWVTLGKNYDQNLGYQPSLVVTVASTSAAKHALFARSTPSLRAEVSIPTKEHQHFRVFVELYGSYCSL